MKDRELVELAANAAGISSDGLGGCFNIETGAVWNPLNDDGDALRLAAKLSLDIAYEGCEQGAMVRVSSPCYDAFPDMNIEEIFVSHP